MHSSKNFLSFFSLVVLFFNFKDMRALMLSSSPDGKLFELHSLPHGCLTFLGDSHRLENDAIALTKMGIRADAPRSAGMVLYSRPISLLDPHSRKVLSFSTMFAFSIENMYRDGDNGAPGDGLAFLISPDKDLLGSPGYFGLVDSTDLTRNKFIAIEFDTKRDPMFQDPDDNHLGFDINSLSSVQLATSSSLGLNLNLKSGDVITTWIDYKSDEKKLEVFLSKSNLKPKKPLMNVDIDLFDYLKENMFVGFSAATEGSIQLTRVEQWEFTIVEFSPPPPPSSPSPYPSLSPHESGRTFPNPSESRHRHLSRLAIGLFIGVGSSIIVVSAWFVWKKLMEMIQKSKGTKNLNMQTIKSSGEIRLAIPETNPNEVARSVVLEKVLNNKAGLIRIKTVKPSIPLPATFWL